MQQLLVVLFLFAYSASGFSCENWSSPVTIGNLNKKFIPESSGIAVAGLAENRLYHVNDSGDAGQFYVTDTKGNNTQIVSVKNFYPQDVEDMDVGPCGNDTCLYIADIGNNLRIRRTIEVVLVKETATFLPEVSIHKRLKLKYPDWGHNAEALAVHPSGDLYLITKEKKWFSGDRDALIYTITADQVEKGGEQDLALVGKLKLSKILKTADKNDQVVTSFDIHPDGKAFLVLTYGYVIEFQADLNTFSDGAAYQIVPTTRLRQQEAIHYTQAGEGFIYTTEMQGNNSPIIEIHCQ